MTIAEYARSKGIEPGILLTELKKKYPGQKLTATSELPSDFAQAAEKAEKFEEKQPTPQPPAGGMGEAPITKVDEAVQQASHKLVQADRVTLAKAAEAQVMQSSVLGAATGIQAGLEFVSKLIESRGEVLDVITEETLLQTDESLAAIDQSMFNLADRSSATLGKSIQMQAKTQQRMEALRARVARLTSSIGN